MPIKFQCKRCRQLLGIASRKAGSEIQCPKCGISQIVPNEEAASAALAMTRFARLHEVVEGAAGVVVYEDEPSAIETPRPRAAEKTAASRPAEPPQGEHGQPVPKGMILYARRTIYVQGLLLLIVAGVFFGAGYFMRGGDANFQQQAKTEKIEKERRFVQGHVVYSPSSQQLAGDQNAVIIALPDGELPQETLPIQGIRPSDEPPGENHKSVRMISDLGGTYARADAEGQFSIVVPEGTYRLLIISAHATRPSKTEIDELELSEMEEYFELAEHLIHRYKYRWTTAEINSAFNPPYVEFGRDGQE